MGAETIVQGAQEMRAKIGKSFRMYWFQTFTRIGPTGASGPLLTFIHTAAKGRIEPIVTNAAAAEIRLDGRRADGVDGSCSIWRRNAPNAVFRHRA